MPAEILISVRPTLTRVGYVENKTLVDIKVERSFSPTHVGSVFKGRVRRVLPGMQAAFIDVGLERAGFLYVADVRQDIESEHSLIDEVDETEREEQQPLETVAEPAEPTVNMPNIQDLLQEGQQIMVQVAKDPLGTKGARLTTHISLPGRYLVYMPTVKHMGISRRITTEAEKERLKNIVTGLQPQGGVIIRTAGEGASSEDIKSDLEYLYRVWEEIKKNSAKRKSQGLVHAEMDVELRALRDILNSDVSKVIVDSSKIHKKVTGFLSQFMPQYADRVMLYKENQPLFDRYGIDLEISRALERKVWLKSGGYIVFDEAEALVVIDVNTGSYVGKKDLEDTILKTNLEAAQEIVHQLRIRNCGGIIIIDFIDMEKPIHREKVLQALQEGLKRDPVPATVTAMSGLGLVEMTRKRMRPSLVSALCDPCPYCEGKGYIKQKVMVAHEVFMALERELERPNQAGTTVVHCHSQIADWIYEEETETLESLETKLGRPIAFKVEPSYHLEQFEIFTI